MELKFVKEMWKIRRILLFVYVLEVGLLVVEIFMFCILELIRWNIFDGLDEKFIYFLWMDDLWVVIKISLKLGVVGEEKVESLFYENNKVVFVDYEGKLLLFCGMCEGFV